MQNVSLAPLLTLRHCQGDNKSSPFSHDSLIDFCRFRGTRSCQQSVSTDSTRRMKVFALSRFLTLSHSLSLAFSRSLALSLSRSLALSLSRSLVLSLSHSSCLHNQDAIVSSIPTFTLTMTMTMTMTPTTAWMDIARLLSPALSCSPSLAPSLSLTLSRCHSNLVGRSCKLSKVVSC